MLLPAGNYRKNPQVLAQMGGTIKNPLSKYLNFQRGFPIPVQVWLHVFKFDKDSNESWNIFSILLKENALE